MWTDTVSQGVWIQSSQRLPAQSPAQVSSLSLQLRSRGNLTKLPCSPPSSVPVEGESSGAFLWGLQKNSFCCHQKTQRSKEVRFGSCVCTGPGCLGAKGSPGAICKVSSWPLLLGPAPDLRAASPSSASLFCAGFGKGSPLSWADRMAAAYRV